MNACRLVGGLLISALVLGGEPLLGQDDVSLGPNDVRFFAGEALIETDDLSHSIFVALDERRGSSEIDGIADHLFVLQQLPEQATTLVRRLTDAQLSLRQGELSIMSRTERFRMILALGSSAEAAVEVPLSRPGSSGLREPALSRVIVRRVEGFGLAHVSGGFEGSLEETIFGEIASRSRMEEDSSFWPSVSRKKPCLDGGAGGASCDSGGCGASSCTVTGCTNYPTSCGVTCATDWWGCCDCMYGARCHCFPASDCKC